MARPLLLPGDPPRGSPGTARRRIGTRAFALIELLVVIAIIALLVSILAPSLRQAKDLAHTAVCQSTIRGAGMTLAMYCEDQGLGGKSVGIYTWFDVTGDHFWYTRVLMK